MNTPWIRTALVALACLIVGAIISRVVMKKEVVQNVVATNIDSLRNVWSQEIQPVWVNADSLRRAIRDAQMQQPRPKIKHDTLYIPVPFSTERVPMYSMALDSTVRAITVSVDDEDSLRDTVSVPMRMGVSFVGNGINRFNIDSLKVGPVIRKNKVTKKVVDNTNSIGLWLTAGGRPTWDHLITEAGAAITLGPAQIGWSYRFPEQKGEYRIAWRILGL